MDKNNAHYVLWVCYSTLLKKPNQVNFQKNLASSIGGGGLARMIRLFQFWASGMLSSKLWQFLGCYLPLFRFFIFFYFFLPKKKPFPIQIIFKKYNGKPIFFKLYFLGRIAPKKIYIIMQDLITNCFQNQCCTLEVPQPENAWKWMWRFSCFGTSKDLKLVLKTLFFKFGPI